jgi:hypothetical protein
MRRHLELHSEPVGPTGGINAEGARRPLGRPRLDPLTLVVREALQNSWDAKVDGRKPVRFSIDGRDLDETQIEVLRKRFFRQVPPKLPLKEAIARNDVRIISISDRNTFGLSGPTRADRRGREGGRDNFVEFFRNIGRSIEEAIGGGTYGYGKAAFYLLSEAHTIVAYSHCVVGERIESRLMASALGSNYAIESGRRFTGRHWWGQLGREGIAEPIRGQDADDLAAMIGLPPFEGELTGTSICVVQPQLGAFKSLQEAIAFMSSAAVWYAWPKLLRQTSGRPEMQILGSCNGDAIRVASPEDHPQLKEFVAAYRIAGSTQSADDALTRTVPIRILRPERDLGRLGLAKFVWGSPSNSTPVTDDDDSVERVDPARPLHHVALMRGPKLIVEYREGPRLANDHFGYAGAFIADPDMDRTFADSEPPTHDSWSPESLNDRTARSCVKVALREIDRAVTAFVQPPGGREASGTDAPLGRFAHRFGSLLPDAPGVGAEQQEQHGDSGNGDGRGGNGSGKGRSTIKIVGEPTVILRDSKPLISISFTVGGAENGADEFVEVEAVPHVIIAGGNEIESPIGSLTPEVIGWRTPSGAPQGIGTNRMRIPRARSGVWQVEISCPRNTVVGANLRVVGD